MINEFSIIHGGLLQRFFDKIHLLQKGESNTGRSVLFVVAVTWLPLMVLAAYDHVLFGSIEVPLWMDFATHIRFLVVIPLMFLAEKSVHERSFQATNQFIRTGLIDQNSLEQFRNAMTKADRMCESLWAEIFLFVIVLMGVYFKVIQNELDISTWYYPWSDSRLSAPGIWLVFVSLPLFQFLVLRWIWRWLIWFRFLFLVSKIKFRLYPAHPDKAGGLGFLGEPPLTFGPITLALGVLFAAMLANRMVYLDYQLQDHLGLIGLFVLMVIFINVAPLLVFGLKINRARRMGIFDYSSLIIQHHREFDDKWIEHQPQEGLLGSSDPSSGMDLSGQYDFINQMRPFPFDLRTMLASLVISVIPILPLFAIEFPIVQLIGMLVKMLV